MPNKTIHRSINPDSPTRIVEAVNINKNAYTKNLARGYFFGDDVLASSSVILNQKAVNFAVMSLSVLCHASVGWHPGKSIKNSFYFPGRQPALA